MENIELEKKNKEEPATIIYFILLLLSSIFSYVTSAYYSDNPKIELIGIVAAFLNQILSVLGLFMFWPRKSGKKTTLRTITFIISIISIIVFILQLSSLHD